MSRVKIADRQTGSARHQPVVPKAQRARVLQGLLRFAERVPARVRPQLSYAAREHGNVFTLVERRPDHRNANGVAEIGIARLRYNVSNGSWTLLRTDRQSRWYTYEGFENREDVDDLIREIEADPYHLFFG